MLFALDTVTCCTCIGVLLCQCTWGCASMKRLRGYTGDQPAGLHTIDGQSLGGIYRGRPQSIESSLRTDRSMFTSTSRSRFVLLALRKKDRVHAKALFESKTSQLKQFNLKRCLGVGKGTLANVVRLMRDKETCESITSLCVLISPADAGFPALRSLDLSGIHISMRSHLPLCNAIQAHPFLSDTAQKRVAPILDRRQMPAIMSLFEPEDGGLKERYTNSKCLGNSVLVPRLGGQRHIHAVCGPDPGQQSIAPLGLGLELPFSRSVRAHGQTTGGEYDPQDFDRYKLLCGHHGQCNISIHVLLGVCWPVRDSHPFGATPVPDQHLTSCIRGGKWLRAGHLPESRRLSRSSYHGGCFRRTCRAALPQQPPQITRSCVWADACVIHCKTECQIIDVPVRDASNASSCATGHPGLQELLVAHNPFGVEASIEHLSLHSCCVILAQDLLAAAHVGTVLDCRLAVRLAVCRSLSDLPSGSLLVSE
eukprot:4143478-Amphidinium_carterae.1